MEGLGDYFAMNMWPQPQMPPPPAPAPPPPPAPPPQQQWGAQLPMSPNVEDRSTASPHVGYVPPQPQLQTPWQQMEAPSMAEAPRADVAEQMRGPSPLARDAGVNDIWAPPPGLRDMVQHPDNAQLTPEMQMSMVLMRGRMNDPDIIGRVNPPRRLPDLGRYGW